MKPRHERARVYGPARMANRVGVSWNTAQGEIEYRTVDPKSRLGSHSIVGIFARAIWESDLPDFVSGNIQNLQFDVMSKLKKQIACLLIVNSFNHKLASQSLSKLFNGVNDRWQAIFLLMIKAAEARPSTFNESPVLGLESGPVAKQQRC
jgi:hypothetical protein